MFKTILLHFQPSSSPGDCTFEHDTCQWLFPGSVSEQTFFWNRTNADELKAQGLQGPGFDHVGNKRRTYKILHKSAKGRVVYLCIIFYSMNSIFALPG